MKRIFLPRFPLFLPNSWFSVPCSFSSFPFSCNPRDKGRTQWDGTGREGKGLGSGDKRREAWPADEILAYCKGRNKRQSNCCMPRCKWKCTVDWRVSICSIQLQTNSENLLSWSVSCDLHPTFRTHTHIHSWSLPSFCTIKYRLCRN